MLYWTLFLLSILATPRPKVTEALVTLRPSGPVLWVIGTWRTNQLIDSSHTRVITPLDTLTHRGLPPAVRRDSFAVVAPGLGGTVSGTWGVRVKRRALWSAWAVRSWSYTTPDAPPEAPVLDSIEIQPDTIALQPLGTQQFCAFLWFDDRVAVRTTDPPYCHSLLASRYVLHFRTLTPAHRAAADRTCIRWSATGGVITGEPCAVPS
jgi:hypothetical protein